MFLGHQVYGGRHGHGWHSEAGRQRLHGARHHAQPRPSLAGPKPLAPRRGASKGLVIPALQGREKNEKVRQSSGRPPLHFSTAFCLIKAAACEATSSSRRSVPRASRLLNSLSRTCRAWRKKNRERVKKRAQRQSHYQQGTQSNCGLTS